MKAPQKTSAKPKPPSNSDGRAELEAEIRGIQFDANLQCDRCGARAYSWILINPEKSDNYLSFCNHHLNEFKSSMAEKVPNALILDRTDLLIEDRKKGQA